MNNNVSRATSVRRGFTLVELLVVIAIIGILVGLTLPAVQMAREAARRAECQNNLKQIGLALSIFSSSNQQLPVAVDSNRFTWITKILPQMEQQPLYDEFTLTSDAAENTNTQNFQFIRTGLKLLQCPSDPEADSRDSFDGVGLSNYTGAEGWVSTVAAQQWNEGVATNGAMVTRPALFPLSGDNDRLDMGGVFRPGNPVNLAKIRDGASNTVMVAEAVVGGYSYPGGAPNETEANQSNAGSQSFGNSGNTRSALIGVYPTIVPNSDSSPSSVDGYVHGGTGTGKLFAPTHVSYYAINNHWPGASTPHQTLQCVFADGSVHSISLTISNRIWQQLNAMSDGTVIDESAY